VLLSLKIQMSAQTTPTKLVNQITGSLVKKNANLLGCQPGKWLLLFIDDLNIPQVDSFGDQPTLETLRYILQTGSALDAKKNQIRPISDLTFIAACDSPSSGRSTPSKRLLQSFSIFALPDPAAKQLFHIYTVRLGRFFNSADFTVDVRSSIYLLVSACLVMYYRVSINILPTPSKVHYVFNLRDLAKLTQGIMQASPINITSQERVRDESNIDALLICRLVDHSLCSRMSTCVCRSIGHRRRSSQLLQVLECDPFQLLQNDTRYNEYTGQSATFL
jgi:dynein heavy chain, axonemal